MPLSSSESELEGQRIVWSSFSLLCMVGLVSRCAFGRGLALCTYQMEGQEGREAVGLESLGGTVASGVEMFLEEIGV